MKPNPLLWALMTVFSVAPSWAEQLANTEEIQSVKTFSPPKPIAPTAAQGYFPENQFDRTDRSDYYFVTENIDQAFRPLKANSGFYGKSFYNSVTAQARGANVYGVANLNHTKANGYKDGGRRDTDWKYSRFNQALVLGFVPSENQEYRLTYLHDDINDDRQPQFVNDALDTERHISKLNARWGNADLSNTVSAEAGIIKLKRRADNYSLRQNNTQQKAFVELDRKVYDFSLKHDADFGKFHNTAAASYRNDSQNGERNAHTPMRDFLNGYRFADVHIDRWRIADTLSYKFDDRHKLGLGLSYELNEADIRKNTTQPENPTKPGSPFPSSQQIWKNHYGYDFNGKVRRRALSGELKYDFTPSETQKYSVSLVHLERIGDNTERFNSLATIAGNPLLKTEKHNRIKLTADSRNDYYNGYMNSLAGAGWNVGSTLVADKVKDLIIFDRARGQSGISSKGNGIITRNVDARLFTAQAYARYNFNPHWAAGIKAAYNYGHNETDGRPLYQIRPFEAAVQADYKNYFTHGSYNIGAATRFVAKQTRGDFDAASGLGIDKREAAKGFTVADVYAGVNIKDKYGLRLGVNNVFNKKYAEHISGDHVLALSPSVVYAPGRTYWLSLHAAF
ncbi:TonB-dependent receptor [Neisseria polysaccharea]|uniref:TonB-dependent receptor n=1 Tax=Neisseria polysaccharea TaxID=489 RepID=UPI00272CD456|nr:TonB-dependent receptor [Neisseria polysaccharea]